MVVLFFGACGFGGSGFFVTVTLHVCINPLPSVVEAVIVVVPGLTPVILPSDETDAIEELADDQEIVLFFASLGLIETETEVLEPSCTETEDLLNVSSAQSLLSVFGSFLISDSIALVLVLDVLLELIFDTLLLGFTVD